MTLRLADLEAPLDDVEFPTGSKHVPLPFGPTEYRLWRELPAEPDAEKRGAMLMAIVKACYPTATDEDLGSLTPKMWLAIAAHAGRKIEQVIDSLKNVAAVEQPQEAQATPPPPATTPSSPKTSGNTPSRKSRGRSGKTSGTSTTAALTVAPS